VECECDDGFFGRYAIELNRVSSKGKCAGDGGKLEKIGSARAVLREAIAKDRASTARDLLGLGQTKEQGETR
jgi:hypothetical protein